MDKELSEVYDKFLQEYAERPMLTGIDIVPSPLFMANIKEYEEHFDYWVCSQLTSTGLFLFPPEIELARLNSMGIEIEPTVYEGKDVRYEIRDNGELIRGSFWINLETGIWTIFE